MMKKVIFTLIGLVAVLGLLFFIPTTFLVERSVTIGADAAAIYPYVNNLQRWTEWSAWSKEKYPTMVYQYEGPSEGVGAISRWTEESQEGKLVITQSDPSTGISYDLEFDGGSMVSKGSLTFSPADGGTKITWKSYGDASLLFKPMLDGMIGPDFEQGLAKLKTIVESAPAMPADTSGKE